MHALDCMLSIASSEHHYLQANVLLRGGFMPGGMWSLDQIIEKETAPSVLLTQHLVLLCQHMALCFSTDLCHSIRRSSVHA